MPEGLSHPPERWMEMELLTLSAPLIHLCRPTLFSTVSEIFFNSTNYYKS